MASQHKDITGVKCTYLSDGGRRRHSGLTGTRRQIGAPAVGPRTQTTPIATSGMSSQHRNIPNGWPKEVLSDVENLREEKIDGVLNKFLEDSKEFIRNQRLLALSCAYMYYIKSCWAYTRILAKKYPSFYINVVPPGHVKKDINDNSGMLAPNEGAKAIVRLALLPDGGPSGLLELKKNHFD
ncbi:(+)-neomenthol dehydrogenase-like [Glycine soja]|nr:(+)-neomenthol dehydrogenase-like [Glycine soja]